MQETIFINVSQHETRAVRVIQGVLHHLEIEHSVERGYVGDIFYATVARVIPGVQAAFVDWGGERNGFIHVSDVIGAREHMTEGEVRTLPPIDNFLSAGQRILVQVTKDALGSKGPRLSMFVSLVGRNVIYLPYSDNIGVSHRIEDLGKREEWHLALTTLRTNKQLGGGLILRTNGAQVLMNELESDVDYLIKSWTIIMDQLHQPQPTQQHAQLIRKELTLMQRVLRDWVNEQTTEIVIDQPWALTELLNFSDVYFPSVKHLLKGHKGTYPIFEFFNIEAEIQKALGRTVKLKSGGYLVFDHTEALHTIDVNTGSFVGRRNFAETIYKTNLEAAQEIGRQIGLRNIGGIIIVDFIDMEDAEQQAQVVEQLRNAFAKDYARVKIYAPSALGLVEISRKRTRESLDAMLCQPCPLCAGLGKVKTPRAVCYDILREISREARQFNCNNLRVFAAAAVIEQMHDYESEALAHVIEEIGKPIELVVDISLTQTQFDIVLG